MHPFGMHAQKLMCKRPVFRCKKLFFTSLPPVHTFECITTHRERLKITSFVYGTEYRESWPALLIRKGFCAWRFYRKKWKGYHTRLWALEDAARFVSNLACAKWPLIITHIEPRDLKILRKKYFSNLNLQQIIFHRKFTSRAIILLITSIKIAWEKIRVRRHGQKLD